MKYETLDNLMHYKAGTNTSRLKESDIPIYKNEDFEHDLYSIENIEPKNRCLLHFLNNKATVMSKTTNTKVINANFIECTLLENLIYPWYFCFVINESRGVAKQLEQFTEGSFIKRVSLKSLNELKIPLPEMEEQKRIGQIYKTALINKQLMKTQGENLFAFSLETIKKNLEA